MLFHYTSLNGLLGIIDSNSIWASHTDYLNGSTEIQHALRLLESFSRNIYMEDDYLSSFGWAVGQGIRNMVRATEYICSFSREADLLSQWRGYCPKGSGVCLGFDEKIIRDYCNANGFVFSKCLYNENEQKEDIRKILNDCYQSFPKPLISRDEYNSLEVEKQCEYDACYREHLTIGLGKKEADFAIEKLCKEIQEYAPLIKDGGFYEENEWRVVVSNPKGKISYRVVDSYLVPYMNISFLENSKDALKKIVIGPNPNAQKCAASIKLALKSKGFMNTQVEISSIPFNNW